jgi:hypothetical protein
VVGRRIDTYPSRRAAVALRIKRVKRLAQELGVEYRDTVAEARTRGEHTALRNDTRAITDVLGRYWGYQTKDAMMLGELQFEEWLRDVLPLLLRYRETLPFQRARHRDPRGR